MRFGLQEQCSLRVREPRCPHDLLRSRTGEIGAESASSNWAGVQGGGETVSILARTRSNLPKGRANPALRC